MGQWMDSVPERNHPGSEKFSKIDATLISGCRAQEDPRFHLHNVPFGGMSRSRARRIPGRFATSCGVEDRLT